MSTDPALLERLQREGKVIFTPCKNLPGKSVTSYDDRFIMDLALEFDAAIISNDNYRDLVHESESRRSEWVICYNLFIDRFFVFHRVPANGGNTCYRLYVVQRYDSVPEGSVRTTWTHFR